MSRAGVLDLLVGDRQAEKVVPRRGHTVWLTGLAAGIMAFIAVLVLVLALVGNALAARWTAQLDGTATLRVSAPADQVALQTEAALGILQVTPGVTSVRRVPQGEQLALLAPWLGTDLPQDLLDLPVMIDVTLDDPDGAAVQTIRQRLAAEAPGAMLDLHDRWRDPLVDAASTLRGLSMLALVLMLVLTAAMVSLSTHAALSSNAQVVSTLRLIGARDAFIARAFVRRFTLRAGAGALVGMVAALVLLLIARPAGDHVFAGTGLTGWQWLWPLLVPLLIAIVALITTRQTALARLRKLP
ncbi:cell division protein FtsX [Oceanomicrobium pacificus]|uniref:Cell division protein FtsX n=1 Tax=Oceanomicrobium pacificus TaxID=2692916 RepID=A0A6B0TSL5_9RHOB|nr:FtsX-like permease family protein [Oceanomicrobium pacificus]MXU63983.1 cell division protein FtsX [Oceanomicrobium pacificus]